MHAARVSNSTKADEVRASESISAAGDRDGRRFSFWRAGLPPLLAPRSSALRYGLALLLVVAAYLATILLEAGTGKFTAFPFYAAVVAGAWLGVSPGLLSFVVSS